jgi:hypothetical protein
MKDTYYKKHTEVLVVASKEIDKTKSMVMCQDQKVGQSHNIKTDIVPLKEWNISNIWEQP